MIQDVADIIGTIDDLLILSHRRLEHRLLDRLRHSLLNLVILRQLKARLMRIGLLLPLHSMWRHIDHWKLLRMDLEPFDPRIDLLIKFQQLLLQLDRESRADLGLVALQQSK